MAERFRVGDVVRITFGKRAGELRRITEVNSNPTTYGVVSLDGSRTGSYAPSMIVLAYTPESEPPCP